MSRGLLVWFMCCLFLVACGVEEPTVLDDEFVVIAHRGASMYAPEHTMAAYELAVEYETDYVEVDLQMTADGVLVAMHDELVDRTTEGSGLVADYTFAELSELDAGSWFNDVYPEFADDGYVGLAVPSLEEIFQHFGHDVNYYIETKDPDENVGMEEELYRLLDQYDLLGTGEQVAIQSFSEDSLRLMGEMDAGVMLVQLQRKAMIADMDEAAFARIATYADGVGPNYQYISKDYVQQALDVGLEVHPYTVDDARDMRRLLDWGVTGFFTNDLLMVE